MADALVSFLVNAILENLNSLVQQGLGSGLETELENLKNTLSTIQAVLRDAEAKQTKSEAIENWLRKLKDVAYDIDNVLDDFKTEAFSRSLELELETGLKSKVSTFLSLRNPYIFRYQMRTRMKDIRERLDAIVGEKINFHLIEGTINDVEIERRQTSSLVNELEICGRQEDKEKIIEILLNNGSDDLSVYAIWGMGGIGKTTLAKLVYNDEERVHGHFDLKIWVCVSHDFDILRLTRAIIESVEGGACNIENLDPLQRRLQEKLSGRRFLLVLDDVWYEKHDKWDVLKEALRCGAKGSTVIVTTRIQNVALVMATHPTLHIGYLSEDDSWSLFKQHAFGIGQMEEKLETIGKAITKKCGGVPLAIKALGSMMRFKSTESEWLFVKDNEIWDLSDNGSSILPVLRLSYDDLPPHLRQCFAYCCIFPKDYEMEKDLLILLWMANGFIPFRGNIELYELGHEIFNNLVWRSFLQDVKEDLRGDVTCKMHDLLHDLARSIVRPECCFTIKPGKISEKIRHLSFRETSFLKGPWNEDLCKVQSLRSLVSLSRVCDSWDTFCAILSKQKYLRVLSCTHLERLPMSISHLKHLRYLNFSFSSFTTLPESITCLQNLQTLELRNCLNLRELPRGMQYMRNLNHLKIRECRSLICTPPGLGKLTCLQTLSIFIVGQKSGHNIGELKRLNLRGELRIEELGNVKNLVEATSANLKGKKNLVSLDLSWSYGPYGQEDNNIPGNVEKVLDGLQPPPNLKRLRIKSYKASKFPDWLMGLALQNLVEVCLKNCDRCEYLPPLGKLPFLEVLSLFGMNSVKYFNNECFEDGWNSFPTLKSLKIEQMPNLEEWKTVCVGQSFPCLLDLEIRGCPKLMELPSLPIIKTLYLSSSMNMLPRSVTHLTSLTSLTVCDFDNWNVLSGGLFQNLKALESLDIERLKLKTLSKELDNLSSLRRLRFYSCTNLESLPEGFKKLNSLDDLEICCCDSLTSLPENGLRGLSSLRTLRIRNCKKLESLSDGVRYLTALQELVIYECPEMKSLPDGMQQLTALQKLRFSFCAGLYSLPSWLGSLPSLAHLEICSCENLTSLPNGLQGSSTLKVLSIHGCPVLEERCEKESGTDWPKIAHIPTTYITRRKMESSDC